MAQDDDDDPGQGGSISERAANGEHEDGQDDDELFPLGTLEGDPSVTLKTLIAKGSAVSTAVSLMSAKVPAPKGGLFHPDREYTLLVVVEPAYYKPTPAREGIRGNGRRVKGWEVVQSLKPIFVERVDGEAGAMEANFAALLDSDEKAAGELLDKLTARLRAKLNGGRHPSRAKSGAAS